MVEGALEMPSLLPSADHPALLAALPIAAEYCNVAEALRAGRALAYVVGDMAASSVVVIEDPSVPDEAFILGKNPFAIVRCMQALQPVRWPRLNVARGMERQLCRLLRKVFGGEPTAVKVVVFVLPPPPRSVTKLLHAVDSPVAHLRPLVRPLSHADEALLLAADPDLLQGRLPRDVTAGSSSLCVGAVEDGRLVCLAQLTALWHRYGALAVATAAEYRHQGFATACLALAVQLTVAKGVLPVFPCREDNWPAVRLAHRLGFKELTSRVDIHLSLGTTPEDTCPTPQDLQRPPHPTLHGAMAELSQPSTAGVEVLSANPHGAAGSHHNGSGSDGDGSFDSEGESDDDIDQPLVAEDVEIARIPVEELLRVARLLAIALPTPDLQDAVGFAPQGDYDTNDDHRLRLTHHLFLHFDSATDMPLVRYLLRQEISHTLLLRFPTETVRILSLLTFEHGDVRDLRILWRLHRNFPEEFELNYLCGGGRRTAITFFSSVGELEAAEALQDHPELEFVGEWHSNTRRELHGLAMARKPNEDLEMRCNAP